MFEFADYDLNHTTYESGYFIPIFVCGRSVGAIHPHINRYSYSLTMVIYIDGKHHDGKPTRFGHGQFVYATPLCGGEPCTKKGDDCTCLQCYYFTELGKIILGGDEQVRVNFESRVVNETGTIFPVKEGNVLEYMGHEYSLHHITQHVRTVGVRPWKLSVRAQGKMLLEEVVMLGCTLRDPSTITLIGDRCEEKKDGEDGVFWLKYTVRDTSSLTNIVKCKTAPHYFDLQSFWLCSARFDDGYQFDDTCVTISLTPMHEMLIKTRFDDDESTNFYSLLPMHSSNEFDSECECDLLSTSHVHGGGGVAAFDLAFQSNDQENGSECDFLSTSHAGVYECGVFPLYEADHSVKGIVFGLAIDKSISLKDVEVIEELLLLGFFSNTTGENMYGKMVNALCRGVVVYEAKEEYRDVMMVGIEDEKMTTMLDAFSSSKDTTISTLEEKISNYI